MNEYVEHEIRYLDICIREIEKKVQWGQKEEWTNYHFTKLSDDIFQSTNVRLSVSSIRRLLGQDKSYKDKFNPQIETKNALAKYLNYESWADFKEKNRKRNFINININRKVAVYSLISILILLILILLFRNFYYKLFPEEFYFSGRNLTGTHPHTVTFQYDVSKLRSDNIQIDFNEPYNSRNSIEPLPKNEHIITHTYFNADYYTVVLIYNNKPIAVEHVLVTSNEWEGGIIQNNEYFMLPESILTNDSMLFFSHAEIASNGIDTAKEFETEYKYVKDFPLSGDDFILSANVTSCLRSNRQVCSYLKCIIKCADEDHSVILTSKGCTSLAGIFFSDSARSGRYDELPMLAQNLFIPNELRIEVLNKKVSVFFGDKKIYSLSYSVPVGNIKCIRFVFSGTGKVDNVKLTNPQHEIILFNTFSPK